MTTAHSTKPHPAREAALAELHARPAPEIPTPAVLVRYVFARVETSGATVEPLVDRLSAAFGGAPAPSGARYHVIGCEGGEVRWEQHAEFETCTLLQPCGRPPGEVTGCRERIVAAAGEDFNLLSAMQLEVTNEAEGDREPAAGFCISEIAGGRGLLSTDFRAGADGCVALRLTNFDLPPAECGVFAQRVLEIETYRMLALLALPLARRAGAAVHDIEEELQRLTRRIEAEGTEGDSASLFGNLSRLAARIETEIAATSYRFSAAAAYGAIVEDRLVSLREAPWRSHPQAGRFLMTRLTPALRTCESMRVALGGLAERCARASDLMRTRIDLQLARQNNELLAALNARTKLQMRLQQTVEGLSIAALSYYIAGLALYLLKGMKDGGFIGFDPSVTIAFLLPVIVIGVTAIIWRIRRLHNRDG